MQGRIDGIAKRMFGTWCFCVEIDKEPRCKCGCQTEQEKVASRSVVTWWFSGYLSHQSRNILAGRGRGSRILKVHLSIRFVWEYGRVYTRPSICISRWLSELLY